MRSLFLPLPSSPFSSFRPLGHLPPSRYDEGSFHPLRRNGKQGNLGQEEGSLFLSFSDPTRKGVSQICNLNKEANFLVPVGEREVSWGISRFCRHGGRGYSSTSDVGKRAEHLPAGKNKVSHYVLSFLSSSSRTACTVHT